MLDKQFLKKKKCIRGNQSPFMDKTLSKAIILRTKLKNKFLKNRTNESKTNYVKNDEKNICDNKTFWEVAKPMLSKKITLTENNEIIKTEKELQKF